jgi:hypothetical protein
VFFGIALRAADSDRYRAEAEARNFRDKRVPLGLPANWIGKKRGDDKKVRKLSGSPARQFELGHAFKVPGIRRR